MPYGPSGQRVAPRRLDAGADREDEQRAATGVDDVAGPALQARDMGRTDAGRGAPDPPQRARVVELEHALADGDDGDASPAVKRGDAAGLGRHRARGRDLPAAHDAQRVAALVADEAPRCRQASRRGGGRRRAARGGPPRRGARPRAGGRPTPPAPAPGRRHARARGGAARPAGRRARRTTPVAASTKREPGRIAQRHGDQTAGRVGHDAFGTVADRGRPCPPGACAGPASGAAPPPAAARARSPSRSPPARPARPRGEQAPA